MPRAWLRCLSGVISVCVLRTCDSVSISRCAVAHSITHSLVCRMSSTTSSLKSGRQLVHCTSTWRHWRPPVSRQDNTVLPLQSVAYHPAAMLPARRQPPSRSSSTATRPWPWPAVSAVHGLRLTRVDTVTRAHCRRRLRLTTGSVSLVVLERQGHHPSAARHTQLQTTVRLNSPYL